MPYVYKYTDKNDGQVKYVGIVKTDNNFPRRFTQHKQDKWYWEGDWEIEYIQVETLCDAEALEGHFIAFYRTDCFYNKAKVNWGLLSFAPTEFKWVLFDKKAFNIMQPFCMYEKKWLMRQEVDSLQKQLDHLESQLEQCFIPLSDRLYDDIRDWIRSRLEWDDFRLQSDDFGSLTFIELLDDYCNYKNIPIKSVEVSFGAMFEDFIYNTTIIPNYVKGDKGLNYARFRRRNNNEKIL